MPVFDNPRKVIVIPGGGDPVAGFLALLGIAALVVAGIAIDWFLVTYALILEAGAVAIVVILTAGTLLARRYLTVLQWDESAAAVQAARRARVQRARVLGVVIHRHVVVHRHIAAAQAPALEARRVVPGAVIPAADPVRERTR